MKTHITRMVLQGFKSFNKRVSIPLLPGFNVIAGPNGSGKSNVVDAVVFVIGKTSARSLRADRLHELIFHGGGERTPAEYASVTLFLDNTKRTFPFDEDEISVTRKVNRRGVSVYKLNGKTTTREKVLQILGGVHVNPDGHNIVLQGDVTQIIEMNPVERRYILDEISGIAEYNDKKEKAQKDLESVDQKLKEAEIVITQRYDIFKKLEADRNAAMRFQEAQTQLRVAKASYVKKRLETFEADMGKIDEKLVAKEAELKASVALIEQTEEKLDRSEAEIRAIANKVVDISKKVTIEREVSELRAKIMITKDKIVSNESRIDQIGSLIEKMVDMEEKKAEFFADVPKAVRAIVGMKMAGVHGTVASLITANEDYKLAVEVAAGPHMNDIVVDDENVASTCIEYLRRERIGRATFIPLSKIRRNAFRETELLTKRGVIGVASELVKYDKRYAPAIEFVFGNTLVVNTLDVAKGIGIGKARMVTLDGDLTERSGVMIGGHHSRDGRKVSDVAATNESEKYGEVRSGLMRETAAMREELVVLEKRLQGYAMSESTKEFIDLEKSRVGSEKEVDEMRAKRKSLHEARLNLEIEANRLKVDRARLEAEVDMVKAEAGQYEGVPTVEETVHKLQSQIRKLEAEMQAMGPVNMKSIDEYDKFRAEFDGYKVRYDKILEEKKAVVQMIEEIEVKRKETFNKTLEVVAREFASIFAKMAKGTAEVVLENVLDIESGLLIKANPRGKMLLNIDSMSGGEKTLTAMAFIMAVQRYHSAPFYIFDEVDAALDKENSRQLAQMLKLESKDSQFIMITHNDETIKIGDRVYGVTIDRGETKILGLELPKE
ncbi:MAG: AAA family ATPase [Candidatus Aenigmarchaeota archaeon]|nr:AAA family ATPase [Candidatus Aenigmarchaeota archaeon]